MIFPKPQKLVIDSGNSLTRGLTFDSNFSEGAGLVSRETATGLKGTHTATTWVRGPYGWAVSTTAATGRVNFVTTSIQNSQPLTSYEGAFLLIGASAGSRGRIFAKSSSAVDGWAQFLHDTNQDNMEFSAAWSGGSADWHVPKVSLSVWHHFVVTYDDRSTSNNPSIWIDGVAQTVTAGGAPSGSHNADTATMCIGNRDSGNRNHNGYVSHIRQWNRILTASEVRRLYENPWCIYHKPSLITRVYNSIAGSLIKTFNGNAYADTKTVNGLAIASVKTRDGLA